MNKPVGLFKEEKTLNAILYIASRMGGAVDMHKLSKTLYFADSEHLSKYGRSITGDVYIKMKYGPVPSKTDDILKAVRGDSFFSFAADKFRAYFHFINDFTIACDKKPDVDWLSDSDMECLDDAIEKCKNKSFNELTSISHGTAWHSVDIGKPIPTREILYENGETEEYADFVLDNMEIESCL